jgi:hypothetical protein
VRVCTRSAARQFVDAGALDAAAQISVFTKLKLASCAPISGLPEIGFILCVSRVNPTYGRITVRVFDLLPRTNGAPRLFPACYSQPVASSRH